MKKYQLDYHTNKGLELANAIIKSEDLEATVKAAFDAYGNKIIVVTADQEDYEILNEVYQMVK